MGRLADQIIGRSGELFREIDSIPELRGGGVGLIDWEDQQCRVARQVADGGPNLFIVLEIQVAPPQRQAAASSGAAANQDYWTDTRRGALGTEGISAIFSCGSAILGGIALAGEAAAAPATFGATAAAMPLTTAATVASGLQCGISVGRMVNVLLSDSGTELNTTLDNTSAADLGNAVGVNVPRNILTEEVLSYRSTMYTLDVIQILDIARSGRQLLQSVRNLSRTGGVSRQAVEEALTHMTPAQRQALYDEVSQFARRTVMTEAQVGHLVSRGVLRARHVDRFREALIRAIRSRLAAVIGNILNLTGSNQTGGALSGEPYGQAAQSQTMQGFRGVIAHVWEHN